MFNMSIGSSKYWRINNYMQKSSKYFFWVHEVEYIGHVIPQEDVKVDPNIIKSIKEWKIPITIRNFWGFPWLTRYYDKFFKNYGRITTPLTTLLKKDAFSWTPKASKAFQHLKEAMWQAPVLAMLDFTKTFIMEFNSREMEFLFFYSNN